MAVPDPESIAAAPSALGSRMAQIRGFRPDDLDALYRICLATGDVGADAAHLYRDPKLIGHVYTGGYAAISPETVFVAEDDEGVAGYILGPADTRAFEAEMETHWWPPMRARYPDPAGAPASPDARMCHLIHHPARLPDSIVEAYPAHLHINLLPRLRGQGIGRQLVDRWRAKVAAMGATGAHLVVGTRNERAVRFYRAHGFNEIERLRGPPAAIVFGIGTGADGE
jgi:ribosomal protein S18 acetylase RimI-like enzyme